MTRSSRIERAVGLGLVLLIACAPEADPAAESAAESGAGGSSVDPMPPAVAPATSINAFMVGVVDHAAHHIWDIGQEVVPETDEDWDEVAHHSIQLIAGGTLITTGGTGALDANWVRQASWQEWARQVTEAGLVAWEAANRQDLDGVIAAGDDLIVACEGCHDEYKPALPTEGLMHPHY